MKKSIICVIALILGVTPLFAQSKLTNRSKAIAQSAKKERAVKNTSAIRTVNGVQMVSAFVRFNDAIDESLIIKYGGAVHTQYPKVNTVTALIPAAALTNLANEEAIAYIEVANPVKPLMDKARWKSNAARVNEGYAPLSQSYLGTGVIVGVVDQEIQLNHINFWNQDRSRYRIKAFWNQNKDSGKGGYGYTYGKFYTDSASILNAEYDISMMSSGHATHVTGIAAGADHTKDYYGIAQNADIVITSTTGYDEALTDGAAWIMHYADSVGKPCVINISMGSNIGPHDGSSTCCRVLENLVGPGNLIIGAAGNSGDASMHIQKDFTPGDSIVKTMISLQYEYWYPYALIDAWGEEGKDFEFAVVVYDSDNDSIILSSPYFRASQDTTYTFSVDTTMGSGGSWYSSNDIKFEAEIAAGISALNNKPNVYVEYSQDDMAYDYYLGVVVRSDSGTVHIWTEDTYAVFTDNGYSRRGWTTGDGNITIGEGIGVADKVVAVGAYTSRAESSSDGTVDDIAYFSSLGPSVDGRIKPEITAPGHVIYSSIPDKVAYWDYEETEVDGETYYYGSMSGTSMSCPYVTGVVATWLEADPTLDYSDLIQIFDSTAIRDKYTGYNLPDNTWGYGKIDAFHGLLYILGLPMPTGVENVTEHQIVGIYPNPTTDEFHVGFASADEQVTVSVIDLSGRTIYSRTLGNVTAGQEFSFSIADAPNGIYMVTITGKKQTNTYKLVKE